MSKNINISVYDILSSYYHSDDKPSDTRDFCKNRKVIKMQEHHCKLVINIPKIDKTS